MRQIISLDELLDFIDAGYSVGDETSSRVFPCLPWISSAQRSLPLLVLPFGAECDHSLGSGLSKTCLMLHCQKQGSLRLLINQLDAVAPGVDLRACIIG